MGSERKVKQIVFEMFKHRRPDDLLMDAPQPQLVERVLHHDLHERQRGLEGQGQGPKAREAGDRENEQKCHTDEEKQTTTRPSSRSTAATTTKDQD